MWKKHFAAINNDISFEQASDYDFWKNGI